MTQLRKCKCGISNFFDAVLRGLGMRGSSFSDIDAVSHDVKTGRFLIQEFKQENEAINPSQHWMLLDLAKIPKHFTVWIVVKRHDGQIGFQQYGHAPEVISRKEYQDRFVVWWNDAPPLVTTTVPVPLVRPLTDTDIPW